MRIRISKVKTVKIKHCELNHLSNNREKKSKEIS